MAKRLTRITTRTGDDGSTGLGDGARVRKDHPRIEAMGDVDELNSHLGVLVRQVKSRTLKTLLQDMQQHLFDLGAELAVPGLVSVKTEQVQMLETMLKAMNASLPPLQEFILPGGTRAAAQAHVCRCVARRAERALVRLMAVEALRAEPLHYLNRASDLLFVLARVLNLKGSKRDGDKTRETYWQSERLRRSQADAASVATPTKTTKTPTKTQTQTPTKAAKQTGAPVARTRSGPPNGQQTAKTPKVSSTTKKAAQKPRSMKTTQATRASRRAS